MTQDLLDAPIESAASAAPAASPRRARVAALRARLATWALRLPGFGLFTLRALVGLAATGAISMYAVLAIHHLRYPFEIEWMEGGLVDVVRRVLAGQKLYVKPTIDYVPYIYAPLWFYVAAAFAKVFGAGFFSARLCSFVASLGVIALVYRIVQREGKSHLAALLAAGLFAGTYKLAIGFFDVARIDSLFVLFLLAGFHTLQARTSIPSRFVAAGFFTLAYLTKQLAVVAFAPIALHILIAERYKRGLAFAAGGAAMMGGATLLLDWIHGGWFSYFVFWIPRQHAWVPSMWTGFWLQDLLAPLAVSVVIALFYCTVDRGVEGRRFWLAALAGMLGASWMGRLHVGGWPNVMMPGFAMIATLFGLGLAGSLGIAAGQPPARRRSIEAFVLALAAVQLAIVAYDPRPLIPSQQDVAGGRKLLDAIRAVEGEVYLPAHGYLSAMAGKRTYAHQMAVIDVISVGGGKPGRELRAEMERAFAGKRFDAVIIDTGFFEREIQGSYRLTSGPFTAKDGFWPVLGTRTRPKATYVPR